MNCLLITEDDAWEKILDIDLDLDLDLDLMDVPWEFNHDQKKFAVKIYQKDMQYIKNYYGKIVLHSNNRQLKKLILIATTFSDLVIVKFLINTFLVYLDEITTDHLLKAIENNQDFETIKYLIEEINLNLEIIEPRTEDNCLIKACRNNNNLDIIKYLIIDKKMNIYHKNAKKENCLFVSCENNNPNVIKYLIEECAMDIGICDINTNSIFYNALRANNYNIIKYLVEFENYKFRLRYTGFSFALLKGHNVDFTKIILFLIKTFGIEECMRCMPKKNLKNFIKFINNYKIFNKLIKKSIKIIKINLRNEIFIDDCCLLMYNNYSRIQLSLNNPYELHFKDFIIQVDKLKCEIPWKENISQHCKKKYLIPLQDYTINEQLLFKNNQISYFGNRNIVYKCINFLREIMYEADFAEDIQLEGIISKSAMNLYIQSCYSGVIDIYMIDPLEMIQFLKFIDQYPTLVLSINDIENDLINYFDTNPCVRWYEDQNVIEMISRYGLKFMYLDKHMKTISSNNIK